jgi:hypothetical protein
MTIKQAVLDYVGSTRERFAGGEALPAYADGGYPLVYTVEESGGTIEVCPACAQEFANDPEAARVIAAAPYYEGPALECEGGCRELIESAYGDPDAMQEDDYELVQEGDAFSLFDRSIGRRVLGPVDSLPELKRLFDAGGYWPNVWSISDHGNAHLVTDWT